MGQDRSFLEVGGMMVVVMVVVVVGDGEGWGKLHVAASGVIGRCDLHQATSSFHCRVDKVSHRKTKSEGR